MKKKIANPNFGTSNDFNRFPNRANKTRTSHNTKDPNCHSNVHLYLFIQECIMRPIAFENYAKMQIDDARDDHADDTVRPHPGTQNWSIVQRG